MSTEKPKESPPNKRKRKKVNIVAEYLQKESEKSSTVRPGGVGSSSARSDGVPGGSVARASIDSATKAGWDYITLRVRQVPLRPHSGKKQNIFNDATPRGKWARAILGISSETNATTYSEQHADSKTAENVKSDTGVRVGTGLSVGLDQLDDDAIDEVSKEELSGHIENLKEQITKLKEDIGKFSADLRTPKSAHERAVLTKKIKSNEKLLSEATTGLLLAESNLKKWVVPSAETGKLRQLIKDVHEGLKKADEYLKNPVGKYKKNKILIGELQKLAASFEDSEAKSSLNLLCTYLKNPNEPSVWKEKEWLHTIADSLGGPVAGWNGASGTYAANTQMEAIEEAIKGKPGIGVQVKAYTSPGKREAMWYEYTVIGHDKDGKPTAKMTFQIDAERTRYSDHSRKRDKQRINRFLEKFQQSQQKVADAKMDTRSVNFALPEVVETHLTGKAAEMIKLQPGPLYAQVKGQKDTLTLYTNKAIPVDVLLCRGNDKVDYRSYCDKVKAYTKDYQAQLDAIKEETIDDLKKVVMPSNSETNKDDFLDYNEKHENEEERDSKESDAVDDDAVIQKKPKAASQAASAPIGKPDGKDDISVSRSERVISPPAEKSVEELIGILNRNSLVKIEIASGEVKISWSDTLQKSVTSLNAMNTLRSLYVALNIQRKSSPDSCTVTGNTMTIKGDLVKHFTPQSPQADVTMKPSAH